MKPVKLSRPLLLAGGMCCGMPAFAESGFGSGDGPFSASARLGFQVVIPVVLSLRVVQGNGQPLPAATVATNAKNASLTANAVGATGGLADQGDPQLIYTVALP